MPRGKRRIVAALFLFAFSGIFSGLSCLAAQSKTQGEARSAQEAVVYKTATGKSYHRDGCGSLRRSKVETTLKDAVKAGLKPCSICKPPALSEEEARAIAREASAGLYRVTLEGLKSYAEADITKMPRATVIRHVDGDTVQLRFANPQALPPSIGKTETIRMIGVDTPETVHPTKAVQYFGKEASDYTKKSLLGKEVYIALDWDTRDKYDRLLVYIYLENGECHNANLIKNGYANAYTLFPFQFMDEFRALERGARESNAGLWGKEPPS
jgi:micrococcal nuclease